MAKVTFLKSQGVQITNTLPAGTDIVWHRVDQTLAIPVDNVTGGTDTALVLSPGIPTQTLKFYGSGFDSASTGFSKSNSIILSVGTDVNTRLDMHPWDWKFKKSWELADTTGGGDSPKSWMWNIPVVSFQIQGWIKSSGPNIPATSAGQYNSMQIDTGFTTSMDKWGVLSGTAQIEAYQIAAPRNRGGPVWGAISGRITGGETYTPGTFSTSNVFGSAIQDPPRGTILVEWSTTAGQDLSETVIMKSAEIHGTRRSGGAMPLVCEFNVDTPD